MSYDSINPSHYHGDRRFEPIEVIEDWQLNYRLGNAVKYISRNGRKPSEDPVEGLKKAIWYIEREIEALKQPTPYAVSYEDILEDYAACASEGGYLRNDLQEVYDAWSALDEQEKLWDPVLGPIEPPSIDYIGDAEWDSSDDLHGQFCDYDVAELHKDLDQFEDKEIISTFERRGLIFGVDRKGCTYILGITGVTQ